MIPADMAWSFIEPSEGCVDHLYKDDRGFVTGGCGNLMHAATVTNLDWRLSDGSRASVAQVMTDFKAVSDSEGVHTADWYKNVTSCHLTLPTIKELFAARVVEFTDALKTLYPFYNEWPGEGQLAELDMVFNLGIGKLIAKFPTHVAELKKRPPDWQGAAGSCHRANKSDAIAKWDPSDKHERRQIAVRDLFLSCVAGQHQ
jgi:hypothetical protein